MDDAGGALDLVLIFLCSFSLWWLRRPGHGEESVEEATKETAKGGKKFFWRFRAGEEKLEMKIWKVRDSA